MRGDKEKQRKMLQKYNRLQLKFSTRKNSSTGEENVIYHLSLKMLLASLHHEDNKKESAPFYGSNTK